jgi:hypothetical protein
LIEGKVSQIPSLIPLPRDHPSKQKKKDDLTHPIFELNTPARENPIIPISIDRNLFEGTYPSHPLTDQIRPMNEVLDHTMDIDPDHNSHYQQGELPKLATSLYFMEPIH